DPNPRPFIATPAIENAAEFSPDGKWFSYSSDESGREELFVVPFPGPGAKRQISSTGAAASFWKADGRGIGYLTPDRKLMMVEISGNGSNLDIGASSQIFGGQQIPAGRGG